MDARQTDEAEGGEAERAFLSALGSSVRSARAARGMTRKILARDSGVSERYLAQLEAGKGNVSVLVLLRIAEAMAMPVDLLLRAAEPVLAGRREIEDLLNRMDGDALADVTRWLRAQESGVTARRRAGRIALIGLRGAGKSTLGKALAARIAVPFVELNRIIEQEYGGSLDDLFALAGQPAYRRYERRCLERVLAEHENAVIATGGGIVTNEAAFSALLERTHTVWIQATPEEHMARVVDQGDLRPMSDNREAMRDLRQILAARKEAYGRASAVLDTSGRSVAASADELAALAGRILETVLAAE